MTQLRNWLSKASPYALFALFIWPCMAWQTADFQNDLRWFLLAGAGATEDGLLQPREIMALPIHADLVTLSACETAAGKIQGIEGVASLVRAFLLAGARGVVASLWKADDRFTAALMTRFYTHLATGMDTAAALRTAKLDLIRRYGDRAHPYYWAGFTFTGDSVRVSNH